MKRPKSVTVNSLGPGSLTITVKMGARLKARIQLALVFMRIAGWILGKRVEVKDDTANASHHAEATADSVHGVVGNVMDRNCNNCGYRVPEETRLASQPKCERPIDNIDDACHNFAKWIPNARLDRQEEARL